MTSGNPYGVKEGLIFSFPCRSKGDGDYEICNDFILDDWLRQKIAVRVRVLSVSSRWQSGTSPLAFVVLLRVPVRCSCAHT